MGGDRGIDLHRSDSEIRALERIVLLLDETTADGAKRIVWYLLHRYVKEPR